MRTRTHNIWRLLTKKNDSIICSRKKRNIYRCCITSSHQQCRYLSDCYNSKWQYRSSSVIDVTPLADTLRSKIREYTQEENLKLVGILANHGSHQLDSEIYSDRIEQTFEEDGIDYEVWRYPDPLLGTEEKGNFDPPPYMETRINWIKEKIQTANVSTDVHGILIFYPIYPHGPKGPYKCRLTGVYYKTQDDYLRDLVHPSKDVEGLCGTKLFKVRDSSQQQTDVVLPTKNPCTALSVLRILQEYHISVSQNDNDNGNGKTDSIKIDNKDGNLDTNIRGWRDQTISIVNRSEILGRPLAVMLAQKGATVYSIDINSILQFRPNGERVRRCNTQTTTLETCLLESNVVVTGVPQSEFQLPLSSIAEGTTIINVSEFPNVCEETLLAERPDIKYIPQVGKVTVAVLENNLMNLKINNIN